MKRALYVVLGGIVAVLLLAAGFAVGRQFTDGDSSVLPVMPETSVPPSGTASAAPGTVVDGTLTASPRSVAFQGDVTELRSLELSGGLDVSARGAVRDRNGASLGDGILFVSGERIRVAGQSLMLTLRTDLVATQTGVSAPNPLGQSTFGTLRGEGSIVVEGASVAFQGASGPRRQLDGSASITLEPEDFADPLTIDMEGPVTWVDAPASMTLSAQRSRRTTLSWAGGGTITAGAETFTNDFLGIKSSDALSVTLNRANGLHLEGSGRFAQIYSGNVPQLRARADVRLKSPTLTVRRGDRGQFTWAPENLGQTDMVISRIVPASEEAGWVSLGLDKMPQLCGGEPCQALGGDTTGFQRGKGINAVILPATGDERDIRFSVPGNASPGRHVLILVVEGNFDPIRVEVPVDVSG